MRALLSKKCAVRAVCAVQRRKADRGHGLCNTDIGIQQLRYWVPLPLGAELSGGRSCRICELCKLCTPSPLRGEIAAKQNAKGEKNVGAAYLWLPMACRSRSAAAEGAPLLDEVILPNLGGGRVAGFLVVGADLSLLLALRADRVGTALEDFVDR